MAQTAADMEADLGFRMEWVTFNPPTALEYLERNKRNRRIRPRHVRELAAQMALGEWQENAETIKIHAGSDTILDGQHRLAAVVESGATVRMLVAWLPDDRVQDTIDSGVRRTPGDVLSIHGISGATDIAAAARWIYRYTSGATIQHAGGQNPTKTQVLHFAQDHPDIAESIRWGFDLNRSLRVPNSIGTALHWLFTRVDRDRADTFFVQLIEGSNLEPDSPILQLRRSLEREANGVTSHKNRFQWLWVVIVKTWNATVENKPLARLVWKPQRDELPRIAGLPIEFQPKGK